MSDAIFFSMVGLLAAGAIALALVWPQGLGDRSPAPFGHPLSPELAATVTPPKPAPAPVAIAPPASPAPAPAEDSNAELKGAL